LTDRSGFGGDSVLDRSPPIEDHDPDLYPYPEGPMEKRIKAFALDMGVDDVGIAAAARYRSPLSPPLDALLPGAAAMVVMAYKELSSCESPSPQIAMNGRMDLMEFSRSCNYKMARFIERETGARTVTVPVSYPLEMTEETKGCVGDLSLRHAAVAAGLGVFGRHNLVIHPVHGTRILFTAVLTDAALPSDQPLDAELCLHCGACVENCPAGALNEEGQTELMKCLKNSQPYGVGGNIRFWMNYADARIEDQKAMLRDPHYWKLYQAGFLGFQYFCWNCMKSCPVGLRGTPVP
jgi:epoxyqueuosine reductase QueG